MGKDCEIVLSKSDLLLAENGDRKPEHLIHGIFDGAFKQPVKAVKQLLGERNDHEEATQKVENSSHQIGEILGSIVPFAALSIVTRAASLRFLGKTESPSTLRIMGEHATSGFLFGSLLTPSQLKPGDNLASVRANQGLVSAATFAGMSGSSAFLNRKLLGPGTTQLSLGKRFGIAATSGAIGGSIDSECRSGFKASPQELLNSAVGFALFGTAMEAGGSIIHSSAARQAYEVKTDPIKITEHLRERNCGVARTKCSETGLDENRAKSSEPSELFPSERETMQLDLKLLSKDLLPEAREQLLNELSTVRYNGKETLRLLPVFTNMNWMTDAQKYRVCATIVQVRNYYAELAVSDPHLASKSERSWKHSLAALTETCAEAYSNYKAGVYQSSEDLEERFLISTFSQLRLHKRQAYPESSETMRKERQEAAQEIMKSVGYSETQINVLLKKLESESLAAFPTDRCSFGTATAKPLERNSSTGSRRQTLADEADLSVEKGLLKTLLRKNYSESDRFKRMQVLLAEFEEASTNRGLSQESQALFYKQLRRLLSVSRETYLTLHDRRDLAEQALHHAARPQETIHQGFNNTCNVTTIENRIYTRQPHEIVRLLADIAHTGKYTTISGKVIDLRKSVTGTKPDSEARDCLDLQRDELIEDLGIKHDGQRDWSSQLVQTVMAKIAQVNRSVIVSNKNTVLESDSFVFNKSSKLLGIVDPQSIEPVVNSKGKVISTIPNGESAWKKNGSYIQELQPEDLVYDAYGDVRGCISDKSKIQRLYDSFGNIQWETKDGQSYFDANGNLICLQTKAGTVNYDKLIERNGRTLDTRKELERLHTQYFGKRIYLRELDEKGRNTLIDSPDIGTSFYRKICDEITGMENKPISIRRSDEFKKHYSTITVASLENLHSTLKEFQNKDNFPAILAVWTKNPPWNKKNGGSHVVNIQTYDPDSRLVRITNQWGRKSNFLDKPLTLEEVFDAMRYP